MADDPKEGLALDWETSPPPVTVAGKDGKETAAGRALREQDAKNARKLRDAKAAQK